MSFIKNSVWRPGVDPVQIRLRRSSTKSPEVIRDPKSTSHRLPDVLTYPSFTAPASAGLMQTFLVKPLILRNSSCLYGSDA